MRTSAWFWAYFVAVHLALLVAMASAIDRGRAGWPFRIEQGGGTKSDGMTVYYRDELIAYADARDGRITSLALYPPGELSHVTLDRAEDAKAWTYTYWRDRPGSYFGRDLGTFAYIYKDTDGDGATDLYMEKATRIRKVLGDGAWVTNE